MTGLNGLLGAARIAAGVCLAGAMVAAALAVFHVQGLGRICGSVAVAYAHCPACYVALGLFIAGVGLATFAEFAAWRPAARGANPGSSTPAPSPA